MTIAKHIGHGTTINIDPASPIGTSYTLLAQVKSVTPPPPSREEVDTTTLDSTVEDSLPSDPRNMGEVQLHLVWHPGDTNHEILDTAMNSRTNAAWKLTYPTSVAFKDVFSGYVKSLTPTALEGKNHIGRDVVIKLTSAITRTANP